MPIACSLTLSIIAALFVGPLSFKDLAGLHTALHIAAYEGP